MKFFIILTMFFATCLAYNTDGKNCDLYQALSCKKDTLDKCLAKVKMTSKQLQYYDLNKLQCMNAPGNSALGDFFICFYSEFVLNTKTYKPNYEKLQLYINNDEIYKKTEECFKPLFNDAPGNTADYDSTVKKIMAVFECYTRKIMVAKAECVPYEKPKKKVCDARTDL